METQGKKAFFFTLPERMFGSVALYVTIHEHSEALALAKFRFVCGGRYEALFGSLDALRRTYERQGIPLMPFGSY